MKITQNTALSALVLPLVAAKKDCKPPVESEALQELITKEKYDSQSHALIFD